MKYLFLLAIVVAALSCNNKNGSSVSGRDSSDTESKKLPTKAAANPYVEVDISPMDMSYYPVDYPKMEMDGATKSGPVIRIIYSRPHKGGRVIFGGIQKYGSYWRLGANEATEIEFFRPVTIQNKPIAAGRYTMYCIPEQSTWTIILNKNNFTWGLKADTTKELARFVIPVKKVAPVEYFTMFFQKSSDGADLIMTWDEVEAVLPIKFSE